MTQEAHKAVSTLIQRHDVESMLSLNCVPSREVSNNVCVTSKASDQSAHTCSLIRAFASRLINL